MIKEKTDEYRIKKWKEMFEESDFKIFNKLNVNMPNFKKERY
jgi:hypothetical protein